MEPVLTFTNKLRALMPSGMIVDLSKPELQTLINEAASIESQALNAQNHIDSHIRQWRENHEHADPLLRQRAIDSTDALQQLRKSLYGEILPQDDGTFKVFTKDGDDSVTVSTPAEADQVYAQAPTSERRRLHR